MTLATDDDRNYADNNEEQNRTTDTDGAAGAHRAQRDGSAFTAKLS